MAAKIGVSAAGSAAEVADVIDAAERSIRQAEPMVTSLYLEPDVHRDDYTRDPRPDRPGAPAH